MRIERIREVAGKKPWRRMKFILDSGKTAVVTHPENMLLHKEHVILIVDGHVVWTEPEKVNAVVRVRR